MNTKTVLIIAVVVIVAFIAYKYYRNTHPQSLDLVQTNDKVLQSNAKAKIGK